MARLARAAAPPAAARDAPRPLDRDVGDTGASTVAPVLRRGRLTILFACTHNAGRSQMAAAICRARAGARVRVESAGTAPAAAVHPVVAEVLHERGLEGAVTAPQRLTEALAASADVLVTMGCGERCPVVPGARVVDWPLEDPKGQPIERVREICDDIERRVAALLAELDVPTA